MKNKSNKLAKLEKNRFSILTNDLIHCVVHNNIIADDINEVFMGRNRQNSMKWGLCIPLCRPCHDKYHIDRKMQEYFMKEAQIKFEETYPDEDFLKIFLRNYKD